MSNKATVKSQTASPRYIPGYALSTATGSCAGWWYGRYRLVNNDMETLFTFREDHPLPAFVYFKNYRNPDGFGMTEITYDPHVLEGTCVGPYDPNSIVLVSAEREYLRDLARRRKKLEEQRYA